MKKYIKKAIPGCLGSSLAVVAVQSFNYLGVWKLWDFIVNFLFTFIVTTVIVSVCLWLWSKIKRK